MINEFPVLVASKIRVRFDHARLDVRLRLRVKMKPHHKGTLLRPVHDSDEEATEWVRAQAKKHGVLTWSRTGHGPSARFGWTKRLPMAEKSV